MVSLQVIVCTMGMLLRLLYLVCLSAITVICLGVHLWKAIDSSNLLQVGRVEREKNSLACISHEHQKEVTNPPVLTYNNTTEPTNVLSEKNATYANNLKEEPRKVTNPPVLTYHMANRTHVSEKYANSLKYEKWKKIRPSVVTRQLPSTDPRSKTYVEKLKRCLDASNLTEYFSKEKFLTQAITNVRYYVDTLRKFIPYDFNPSLPNHCWNAGVELDISPSLVSGHFNGTKFRVSRAHFEKFIPRLNTLSDGGFRAGDSRKYSMPFSCIPEVFLSGFYKCGSTYLYSLINTHPEFSKATALRKEPDWFTRDQHFVNEEGKRTAFFTDYIVNFQSLVESLSIQRKQHSIKYSFGLDGSAGMMLFWPIFFQQQRIVNFCLLPSVIPEILPKSKFIVVMREPTSMLYSLFWFSCTRFNQPVPSLETQLKGPDIFHERVMDGINAIKSCLTAFPLVKCLIDSANTLDTFHPLMPKCGEVNFSIYVALYYIHIQKWLSVVPRERFLFLTLEELSSYKQLTANQVWSFLKVHSLPFGHIHTHAAKLNKQMAVDYKNNPRLAMRSDTKKILQNFFRPYNQMLADLLGNRKFLWK